MLQLYYSDDGLLKFIIKIGDLMKKAFTLAEVLVTMGIIGVVAALTTPALLSNVQNKGLEARIQKAHNIVSNAVGTYMVNENLSNLDTGVLSGPNSLSGFLMNNFRVAQNCGTSTTGCFASSYSSIDGSATSTVSNCSGGSVLLQDGIALCWTPAEDDVKWGQDQIDAMNEQVQNGDINIAEYMNSIDKIRAKAELYGRSSSSYYKIVVDTNGPKKPNVSGRDLFVMYLKVDGQVTDLTWDPKNWTAKNKPKVLANIKKSADPMPIGMLLTNGWSMDY